MKIKLLLYLIIALNTCFGQKRDQFEFFPERNYIGFHFDDDFLFIGNRDEQYTGGLEIEYIHASNKTRLTQDLINPFIGGQRYWTYTFGSQLFTPYNVSDSLIILNDRPYSSFIYTTIGYTAYDKQRTKKLTTELYFGIMGSELPGRIQDKIHTVGESPPAYGWKNRIAKHETFTPNLRINYQANLWTFGKLEALFVDWIQLGTVYELNMGLYANNISAGLKLSAFNQKPLCGSKRSFNFSSQKDVGIKKRKRKLRTTIYFSPKFEAVVQNTALQGLSWVNSPYKIPTDEMNRYVWDLETGVNLNYGHFHLSYILKARSKEFHKYQENWHSWAGVTLGFSF